uniref:NADH dehydrogenase subunit 6 n=1 Tax=Bathytyphlops marionae TaxID=1916735 RepID=UPI0028FCBC4C|nr:NADH dehydrogenase subunit 6 [Bathytyphlops marionae]WNH38053.1 NADH dehydrogenase subunit 6 [Bathytyphlops marionae]
MAYLLLLCLLGLVLGLVAVASNPAPYFAAFGLVLSAGFGCGLLAVQGGPFLSLVLFLIYLGGMLVVFAYSAALAAEPFPESWGDSSVRGHVMLYVAGLSIALVWLCGGWHGESWATVDEFKELMVVRGDVSGVALMYSSGGYMLVVCGWALLLSLFVVLELTRGLSRGALRAI